MTSAYPDASSGRYVTTTLRKGEARIVHALNAELQPGERLVGLFAVTKIHPAVSVLAVTSQRLLTFDKAGLGKGGAVTFVAEIPVGDVSSFTVCGLMDNVVVERGEAPRVKLGSLDRGEDSPHLLAAVRIVPSPARSATAAQPESKPGATWPLLEQRPANQWTVYVAPDPATAPGTEPEPQTGPLAAPPSRSATTAPPASEKMAALEALISSARAGDITAEEEAVARQRLFASWM